MGCVSSCMSEEGKCSTIWGKCKLGKCQSTCFGVAKLEAHEVEKMIEAAVITYTERHLLPALDSKLKQMLALPPSPPELVRQ